MTLSDKIAMAGIIVGLLSSGSIIGAIIWFGTVKADIKHIKEGLVLPNGRTVKSELELVDLRMRHVERRLESGDQAFIAIRKEQQEIREGFISMKAIMSSVNEKLNRLLKQNLLLWKTIPHDAQERARAELN